MSAKEEILNAAIELFSKKGFEGVSIREIAALANIHFASIRYHFGDKEELYKACISLHGESRLLSAKRFLDTAPNSKEDMRLRLGFAIEDVFRIHNENPFLTKLILQELESLSHRSDTILKNTMIKMTEIYIDFFKSSQKNKLISKEIDPQFLTYSLMGIIHHFMRTDPIRERLLSQKNLKDKNNNKLMIENILNLFVPK